MAIAFDAVANSTEQTVSPCTWNHTVTGSNTWLVVVVGCHNDGAAGNTAASAVTYNGVAMTELTGSADSVAGNNNTLSIWVLHAPAAGTHQVSVAFSGGAGTATCVGTSVSYTGVQQDEVPDAGPSTSTQLGIGTITDSVQTVANNCWELWAIFGGDPAGAPVLSAADHTVRKSLSGTLYEMAFQDTNSAITPPATVSGQWTIAGTAASRNMMLALSFAPAPVVNNIILYCGNDIVWEAGAAKDYKDPFYAYEPVYISIPDATADVTVYFSVASKSANTLPTNVKDYGGRTHASQRNYGVLSGNMNVLAHFSGQAGKFLVAPPRSVITNVSVNIAP